MFSGLALTTFFYVQWQTAWSMGGQTTASQLPVIEVETYYTFVVLQLYLNCVSLLLETEIQSFKWIVSIILAKRIQSDFTAVI